MVGMRARARKRAANSVHDCNRARRFTLPVEEFMRQCAS